MGAVGTLIAKELKLELRNRYALGGILLYVISTIFVCYLSFTGLLDLMAWNALFWIILLFASLNAVTKTFVAENKARQRYMYTLANPQSIILSKIIYNTILVLVLMLVSLLFYGLTLGTELWLIGGMQVQGSGTMNATLTNLNILDQANTGMFIVAVVAGALGFACVFTMVSAIAAQTNNNLGVSAILGFPLILPMLLLLIEFSHKALTGSGWNEAAYYLGILVALDAVCLALAYLLFPYLWHD